MLLWLAAAGWISAGAVFQPQFTQGGASWAAACEIPPYALRLLGGLGLTSLQPIHRYESPGQVRCHVCVHHGDALLK